MNLINTLLLLTNFEQFCHLRGDLRNRFLKQIRSPYAIACRKTDYSDLGSASA